MKHRLFGSVLAIAVALVLAAPAMAQLVPYSQDFEMLTPADDDQPDQLALQNDGWRVFVNVFDGPNYLYGYGAPAPNGGFGGPAFSAVVVGEGDIPQGDQQVSAFSDYNNADHNNGFLIESNLFQEWVVGAADVGATWVFEFDYKPGNIEGATTALAFIKTLDPFNGFALTNFLTVDVTDAPDMWSSGLISINIDPTLVGQILQIGFLNTASNYEGSGVFYDNVVFSPEVSGACCTLFECAEGPVEECIGEYQGDGTTCDEADCAGPLFITLCHVPPGNPGNAHTITVGLAAAQAHLNHGDTPGPCAGLSPNLEDSILDPSGAGARPVGFHQNSTVDSDPVQHGRRVRPTSRGSR